MTRAGVKEWVSARLARPTRQQPAAPAAPAATPHQADNNNNNNTSNVNANGKARQEEQRAVPAAVAAGRRIPLSFRQGHQVASPDSAALLREVGGGDKIREMTGRFYERCFKDKTLDRFIMSHQDPHGDRLGNWIVEHMGGEGTPWSDTRHPNARSEAHHHAWHSHKREPEKRGRRFKLDDCRVWMRLMFWAAREVGLADHPQFWRWYVDFIAYFVAIYERSAPPYAEESAEWSASQENIDRYLAAGCEMTDVIGVGVANPW